MPVRSLRWRKVVGLRPPNRSNAFASRNENERAPLRTAAPIPSSGTPASSKPCTQRTFRASAAECPSPAAGPQYPDRNQTVDIVRFDSGPSGHLLAPFLGHGRPDPRCRSRHRRPAKCGGTESEIVKIDPKPLRASLASTA